MIPAMVWIFSTVVPTGENVHQFQAAAMIINFLLSGVAATRHVKAEAVDFDVWRWLAPAALTGVVLGVAASRLPIFTGENARYLRYTFGAFQLYVVAYNIRRLRHHSAVRAQPENEMLPAGRGTKAGVGLVMGFAAGLLGIGGGALAVPAMQILLHMRLRNAIATSTLTIFSVAWLGAIVKNATLGQDGTVVRSLFLAAILAPSAMAGAYLGGHLTHKLPNRVVRVAFILLMSAAAWKMFAP